MNLFDVIEKYFHNYYKKIVNETLDKNKTYHFDLDKYDDDIDKHLNTTKD